MPAPDATSDEATSAAQAPPGRTERARTRPASRFDPVTVVIVVITLIAAVFRLYRLSSPAFRYGFVGYDDGVYFGASVQLIHGTLPYQDFVFVHPPLVPILMAPFAYLTHYVSQPDAFAVARVCSALVGTAAIALLGRLLRHRGVVAVGLGCAVLALHSDAIASSHSVFLEPYLVIFTLGALTVLFDGDRLADAARPLLWGGILLGLATAVKIFALAPLVVVVLVALRTPSRAIRIVIGAAIGFLVPTAVFLAKAPGTFVKDTVTSQLEHTAAVRTAVDFRLSSLLGVDSVSAFDTTARVVALAGLIAVVALAGYAYACSTERRLPSELEVFAIGSTIAVAAMFVYVAQFFFHYAAFFAPFAALAVALPTTALMRRRETRLGWSAVAAALVVLVLFGSVHEVEPLKRSRLPLALIHRVIPAGACVATNSVSLTLAADRFTTAGKCPVFLDGLGTDIVYGQGAIGGYADKFAAVRAAWIRAFRGATYALIYQPLTTVAPWKRTVLPYLKAHFRPIASGSALVGIWKRK